MIVYSIIQKSQLEGATRLDAEYYRPEYLQFFESLSKNKTVALGSISEKITQGPNPVFIENGKICLNGRNVKNHRVDKENPNYVSDDEFKRFQNFKVQKKDILITLKGLGSIGKTGYVFGGIDAIFSRDIGLIRIKENSEFLYAFLISKYGAFQIERATTGGTGQLTLATNYIKQFQIPLFDSAATLQIVSLIQESEKQNINSINFYNEAENLLLDELGLMDSQTLDDLAFEVNFSEVENASRMDADYFHPKYNALISKIKNKNCLIFSDLIKDYSTGYTFKSENYQENGIPLIRINNIKKGYLDLTDTAYLTEKDHLLSPKDIAKTGDIVLSMSGTVGACALIPPDISKSSINQRILRFRSKNINDDYLVLLLNSVVGQYQLERIGTGGVQTNISYNDIRNILIPILPQPIQEKISDLVIKSHEARKKSKELLEEAKRNVETMIEKGQN